MQLHATNVRIELYDGSLQRTTQLFLLQQVQRVHLVLRWDELCVVRFGRHLQHPLSSELHHLLLQRLCVWAMQLRCL